MRFFGKQEIEKGSDLRIVRRKCTPDERKRMDWVPNDLMVFVPQRLNWWGYWLNIHNIQNERHGGLCHTEEAAQKVLNHYALYADGDEIVSMQTVKALRAKLLLQQ